jgi:hypothetical protein
MRRRTLLLLAAAYVLALRRLTGYSPTVMRRSRSALGSRWRQVMRRVTAALTLAQLLAVASAPLAERADSSVAAVHMEQAGTSRHHAHGDFCAVCAASHLTALPPRSASLLADGLVSSRPLVTDVSPRADRTARSVFARAPPV